MTSLERPLARRIIEVVGAHGIPPEWGFQFFTAGLDPWLEVLTHDYLRTYVGEDGGSAFKLVVGAYGGGKTHFLYAVRERAWDQGFAVSYVPLGRDETPFHKMELVYAAIARNLTGPLEPEVLLGDYARGIGAVLARWTDELVQRLEPGVEPAEGLSAILDGVLEQVENVNFARAVRHAVLARATGDSRTWERMRQWLTGQGHDRKVHKEYGILRGIDRTNAFSMLRSLVRFLRAAGHRGLVVLFDEAEMVPSLSSREKQNLLGNLRELIDSCGHQQLHHSMIFYAVPDYSFFEGRLNVYEALRQRLTSVFDFDNPTGVAVELERTTGDARKLLVQIGTSLAEVYRQAFTDGPEPDALADALALLAEEAHRRRGGDIGYRRLFVKAVIRLCHKARRGPVPEGEDALELLSEGGA